MKLNKKYRVTFKEGLKPSGFIQNGLYVIEEMGKYSLKFKGYNLFISYDLILKVEEVER